MCQNHISIFDVETWLTCLLSLFQQVLWGERCPLWFMVLYFDSKRKHKVTICYFVGCFEIPEIGYADVMQGY